MIKQESPIFLNKKFKLNNTKSKLKTIKKILSKDTGNLIYRFHKTLEEK
jgi:hypothetical protein